MYSVGYHFDFEKMRFVTTGGIYIKSYPAPEKVTIDSKINESPGMFSNWVFIEGLLPENHSILVEKTGYYSYFKNLPVYEKQVTRLENIILIKRDLQFSTLITKEESPFLIKQEQEPDIENAVTFLKYGNNLIWLSSDGFLYQSETNPQKLTTTALTINKKNIYKITASEKNILLNNNGKILIYNKEKKDFENFAPTTGYEKILDCQWINDYYIVFTTQGKIMILETYLEDGTNLVTLPQAITLEEKTIEIKSPQIFFDQSSGKLYIKTGNTILVSEKII